MDSGKYLIAALLLASLFTGMSGPVLGEKTTNSVPPSKEGYDQMANDSLLHSPRNNQNPRHVRKGIPHGLPSVITIQNYPFNETRARIRLKN